MLKFLPDIVEDAVEVSFTTDHDGDLMIQYDGITVAFISRRDGSIRSLLLTDSEIASLQAKGVSFDGDFLEVA